MFNVRYAPVLLHRCRSRSYLIIVYVYVISKSEESTRGVGRVSVTGRHDIVIIISVSLEPGTPPKEAVIILCACILFDVRYNFTH